MAFDKTSISLPTLNLYKTHTKFKNYNNATIAGRVNITSNKMQDYKVN